MSPLVIIAIVFVGAVALIAAVGGALAGKATSAVEDRLDLLTTGAGSAGGRDAETAGLLTTASGEAQAAADRFLARFGDFSSFLAQANVRMTGTQLLAMTIGLGALGVFGVSAVGAPIIFAPVAGVILGAMPLLFISWKRKRRVNAFGRQLPDALELISRALRAGHSLAAGFNLVGDEMADPIASEFARCYEEQNLGVPIEEALEGMTRRVPNLDLRFFATAVILQRQTGGDLAEILDKIGHLVRERFKIWGQIQALTGEGRMSGVVLLGLPPVLFLVMFRVNPDYVMLLFTDPIGKVLMTGAVISQLLGAFVIKKIITIKV